MAPRNRYPVPDLAEWSKSKYYVGMALGRRPAPPGATNSGSDFITTDTMSRTRGGPVEEWKYQGVLGRGTFGTVGLWQKKNENDEVIDELAVKEMTLPKRHLYKFSPDGRELPEEAIVQTTLQRKNCVPILQLRGLSVWNAPTGSGGTLRYYLEYCPYGDLRFITDAYDDILDANPNDDRHIPEPFLWQTFLNFAQVMVAMEQAPFEHPQSVYVGDNPYVLHLDVKPANVMVGLTDDADIIKEYPSIKVGDWGLAKLTSTEDFRNSHSWRLAGTPRWYPPEQHNRNSFGQDWTRQPPWRSVEQWNCHPYTPAHSIFAFASVIFNLMMLDTDADLIDEKIRLASIQEAEVHSNNFRIFESSFLDKDAYGRRTPYSQLLKDTVTNCLNLNPAARPTPTALEQIARNQCLLLAARQYFGSVNTFPKLECMDPM